MIATYVIFERCVTEISTFFKGVFQMAMGSESTKRDNAFQNLRFGFSSFALLRAISTHEA